MTNYITDLVSSFNSASESVMHFVRGASFDKKEFKRNLAGSGSYPPVYTVLTTYLVTAELYVVSRLLASC
jgi:hypothetical protein